jgi:transcriptional antiterminator NusG
MEGKWYTLAVYSGSEVKIGEEINRRIALNSNIKEVFVPLREVTKISRNKKVGAYQKVFPNYVFVRMMDELDTFNEIRNIPRVMGFLGGNPQRPESVPADRIEKVKQDIQLGDVAEEERFEIGEAVRIKEGHFESFNGIVEGKDEVKGVLKIAISIFGRSTVIDIGTSKVEKI